MNQKTFQYNPEGHSKQLYHSPHRLMNWVHSAHIRQALANASLTLDKRILDAGCSDGELLVRANGVYASAVGADHNFQALQSFNQRLASTPHCHALQSDLCRLPFADERFDVVFCLETLEHVYDESRAIVELKRVLKSDGTLIVTVPIELGLSVLLKQGISKLCFGGYRGAYTWGELINAMTGKLDKIERESLSSHKGFDFRKTLREIDQHFSDLHYRGLPFTWLGSWVNTQFLIVARNKIC